MTGVVYQANDRNKADGDKDYVVAIKKLRLVRFLRFLLHLCGT